MPVPTHGTHQEINHPINCPQCNPQNHQAYLMGPTWGAEDLAAAIGAMSVRRDNDSYTSLYEIVRLSNQAVLHYQLGRYHDNLGD